MQNSQPVAPALIISTARLDPGTGAASIFSMVGRCAFAVCTAGELEIRILNERYTVTEGCMFACLPFVDVEVLSVRAETMITFGFMLVKDMLRMVNRQINTKNFSALQSHPVARIPAGHFERLMAEIRLYESECADRARSEEPDAVARISHVIIDLQARLLVALVIRIFFTEIPMEMCRQTHRDIVFQRFMLALYSNFREHRDVGFYASRSGMSPKYFSTVVRQLSGTSPSEWIETLVVAEAKSMLADVHRGIKDIASALNFPDAPTFSKYFRRATGLTPKAYRKTLL